MGPPDTAPNTFTAPTIVGILNITEDSFSDGGQFLSKEASLERAHWMAENGADVIEIGPASSNPDARNVPPLEEIRRIDQVIDEIRGFGLPISIDSYAAETQRYALAAGVDFINDVTGFADTSLHRELAASSCRLVVMNSLRASGRATREDAGSEVDVSTVAQSLRRRIDPLVAAGVDESRIIADPGMGYFLSSAPEASFAVLRDLPVLRRSLGLPVLVSVSRKSFLRAAAGCTIEDAGSATLAAETYAAIAGVEYIRTHDVRALRHAVRVLEATFA